MDHKEIMNRFGGAMHEVWSHWMKHLFTQGWDNSDGTFRIKRNMVEQWKRQMNAPFSELSKKEQETDIKVFQDFFGKQLIDFSKDLAEDMTDKIFNNINEDVANKMANVIADAISKENNG